MKSLLSLLAVTFMTALPAHAADEKKCSPLDWGQHPNRCEELSEQGHRFKLTFGSVVVPQATVPRFDPSAGFRVGQGIRADTAYFANEYLLGNGATYVLSPDHVTLCCPYGTQLVRGPFHGNVGDTFQTWGKRELRSFDSGGVGFAASLEYRMTGNLWGALAFQMSPQTTAWVDETGEFFLVRDTYLVPETYRHLAVSVSRHRVEYEREHKRNAFHFTGLLKYDLTRANRHWSVMPQFGVEVFLLREREYTIISEYTWPIFSGELHPYAWAHEPTLDDERSTTVVNWRTRVQPVAGLTLELYPGRKYNVLGIVLDARYYFNGPEEPYTSFHGDVLELYPVEVRLRRYSLSAYAVLSF